MFGGLCFRPLALADEGLGLTIEATSTLHTPEPVGFSDGSVEDLCFWDTKFGVQTSNLPYLYSFRCKHTQL